MHNEGGPSPSPPCLDVVPKFVFDQLTSIREAKHTLFRDSFLPSMHWIGNPLEKPLLSYNSSSRPAPLRIYVWWLILVGVQCRLGQWWGRFLGIIGWDLSVCKSNQLHVDILWFFFVDFRYIPHILLKWLVILLNSWTSTSYFSNSTGLPVTICWFCLIIG